jgi:hypothetical protein
MLLAALALAAGPPSPPVAKLIPYIRFDMNGEPYHMPKPEGFCRPPVVPAAASADEAQGDITIAKPVFLYKCDDRGRIHDDQEIFYFKYSKGRQTSASRADFLAQNAPKLQDGQFAKWLQSDEVTDKVKEKTFKDTGLKVDADVHAEPLGTDDTCIYTGSRLNVSDGQTKPAAIIIVTCLTTVGRNIVVIDMARKTSSGETFVTIARTLKTIVNTISAE